MVDEGLSGSLDWHEQSLKKQYPTQDSLYPLDPFREIE